MTNKPTGNDFFTMFGDDDDCELKRKASDRMNSLLLLETRLRQGWDHKSLINILNCIEIDKKYIQRMGSDELLDVFGCERLNGKE